MKDRHPPWVILSQDFSALHSLLCLAIYINTHACCHLPVKTNSSTWASLMQLLRNQMLISVCSRRGIVKPSQHPAAAAAIRVIEECGEKKEEISLSKAHAQFCWLICSKNRPGWFCSKRRTQGHSSAAFNQIYFKNSIVHPSKNALPHSPCCDGSTINQI